MAPSNHPANHPTDLGPVIPPEARLPEITIKAIVLSVILAALLAGANAYLGLFAGMTVSASIPAAVASMAILRLFKRSNILENNIVQTAASSGEALAAGVIFTIPALVLVGYWETFHYWQTTAVALVGGLLGVLFTIPLRRALIIEARLRFPEGVATAEVLKVGSGRDGRRSLFGAALLGGAAKFGESGMHLWADAAEGAVQAGRTLWYIGANLSPALLAVGFIIGLKTALAVFLGGALGWFVLMPLYGALNGVPAEDTPLAAAKALWSAQIRYVGIGAMLVGGLWTVGRLRGPVLEGFRRLQETWAVNPRQPVLLRTERDAPLPWVVIPFLVLLVPMAAIYYGVVLRGGVAAGMTLIMALAAFLFSAVAAYMAGLVGSSSNPVSGVTIATIMLAALLLVLILGRGNPAGPAACLLIGAVVCCAAAMGGDNLQDLKTGHLVGATPWKQQIMQVVGVTTGAVVLVPVLSLLQAKYGIGAVTPDHPHPLAAPQATLMAGLAQGMFGEGLPWPLVGIGAGIGAATILLDRRLERRGAGMRVPVLAVALGIYLPLKLSAAILIGGMVAAWARRPAPAGQPKAANHGLLFAAGLVTGEALMGISLAFPLAMTAVWSDLPGDPFALFAGPPLGFWPGLLVMAGILLLLYRHARHAQPDRTA